MDEGVPQWSFVPGNDPYGQSRYCNGVEIFNTQWDFTMELFHIVPSSAPEVGGQPSITRNVVERIVMSPTHAKAFMEILQQNVAQYEQQYGSIPSFKPNE